MRELKIVQVQLIETLLIEVIQPIKTQTVIQLHHIVVAQVRRSIQAQREGNTI